MTKSRRELTPVQCCVCKKPIGNLPGLVSEKEFVCRDCWHQKKAEVISMEGIEIDDRVLNLPDGIQIRTEFIGHFKKKDRGDDEPGN